MEYKTQKILSINQSLWIFYYGLHRKQKRNSIIPNILPKIYQFLLLGRHVTFMLIELTLSFDHHLIDRIKIPINKEYNFFLYLIFIIYNSGKSPFPSYKKIYSVCDGTFLFVAAFPLLSVFIWSFVMKPNYFHLLDNRIINFKDSVT